MNDEKEQSNTKEAEHELVRQVFDDFEARRNIVGLYDLLYKIDRRINPHLYEHSEPDHG